MSKIVCFGEVLWDVFPDGKQIGGAPLNVAYRLKTFQNEVCIISAIGNDDLGKEILDFLKKNNIDSSNIQVLSNFETGKVTVKLNKQGSATYSIDYPKAWDKIRLTIKVLEEISTARVFIYGSLVTRDEVSKNTLHKLLKVAKYKVFDVNLRAPFYKLKEVVALMHKADFIKLNDDELQEIASAMQSTSKDLLTNLHYVADATKTKHLCVTKGAKGAVLLYDNQLYFNDGYKIEVADTVGSGDSFLASLIHKLIHQNKPQEALDFACAIGALVASNKGANPVINPIELKNLLKN
jgi:fructokinase